MSFKIKNIEKIICVIKELYSFVRPKFYNKITWLLVIAGVSILSQSIWHDVFAAFLRQSYGLALAAPNSDNITYGFWLCFLGVTYHVICTALFKLIEKFEERLALTPKVEHDKKIFLKIESLLNEKRLDDILCKLNSQHALRNSESQVLEKLAEELSLNSNSFIFSEIQNASIELKDALDSLNKFIIHNFDMYPYSQTTVDFRICMNPALNPDQRGSRETEREYWKIEEGLRGETSRVALAYKNYRLFVKNQIFI